ncbi:hypothetical protein [Chryseobacterium carnipullorum]|uniref:hypothetical protein n=1 Tax=Chryseobacterium carnipullorum TaxID=1124835 RepID=UPI000E8CB111|nr:hypothetical protein [Chryseobacterium carnipullorum]HBV16360.1 hypothetical protein [Chryseobacterium carnipullorum]
MKKNNFLIPLLLVFLLFSCQTEKLNTETLAAGEDKFKLTSTIISLDQAPHGLILLSEINKIETKLRASTQNAFGKIIDHKNGVSIDTEHVIYIENGPNYHTYTFNIENTPGALLQNLILTPLPDGSYKALIFTYNLTNVEKLNIFKGLSIDTKGKTSITDLDHPTMSSKTDGCLYADETIWYECNESSKSAESVPCTASSSQTIYTIGYRNCTGNNDSGEVWEKNISDHSDKVGNEKKSNRERVAYAFENPTDPFSSLAPYNRGVPTQPNVSNSFAWFLYYLPNNLGSVISSDQISGYYQGFKAYYNINPNNPHTTDFIIWGLNFKLNNPDVSWEQFRSLFFTDTPTGFLQQVVLENPATILNYESLISPDFKMRKIDRLKYPKFTALVQSLKTDIQNNPIILNKLVDLTNLTEEQVLASLTFWKGPSLRFIPNLRGSSVPNYGNFNTADTTFTNIKLEFILGLEQTSVISMRESISFFLALAILNDFIYYGEYISTNGSDMSIIFEHAKYYYTITHLNSENYIIQLR